MALAQGVPTREVYWHIEHVWVMYGLLVPTLLVFAAGVYARYRLWARGRPVDRSGQPGARWRLVAHQVLAHRRLLLMLDDLTWKDRLDLEACTSYGRRSPARR